MTTTATEPRLSRKARLVGMALLAVILYFMFGAGVYFASLLALQKGLLLDIPWFVSTQKSLYRAGIGHTRNNWIQPKCVVPDPDLIYVPADGACEFSDIEFKTVLNFNSEGRASGQKPEGRGIAVIGDSHAMGWGVNDEETFAARLQAISGRPVYNLGVASYGTARELIRLKKSGVLDRVDTIILQYCNNDLGENLNFDTSSKQELQNKIFQPSRHEANSQQASQLKVIARGYALALAAPFRSLSEALRRKNFSRHYITLIDVLTRHQDILESKRVIIFYSNTWGQRYRNFPEGRDERLKDVYFIDLGLTRSDYHKLDDHLTPAGHRKAAERLHAYLSDEPAGKQD